MPGPPTLPMADTYAVVQKRGAPAGTGPGTRAPNSTDTPIYSQVAPRIQRPVSHTENAQGTTALGRGELRPYRDEELRASTCSPVPRSHKVREGLSATRSSGRDPAWPRPQAPNCRGSSPQMSSRSRLRSGQQRRTSVFGHAHGPASNPYLGRGICSCSSVRVPGTLKSSLS